jgi:hypothetical protein
MRFFRVLWFLGAKNVKPLSMRFFRLVLTQDSEIGGRSKPLSMRFFVDIAVFVDFMDIAKLSST